MNHKRYISSDEHFKRLNQLEKLKLETAMENKKQFTNRKSLNFNNQEVSLLMAKENDPNSGVESVLKFLKLDSDSIEGVKDILKVASSIAGAVSFGVGAYKTVESILKLAGVLDKENASTKLLRKIEADVSAIYGYLESESKIQKLKDVERWRSSVIRMRSSLRDLSGSRAQKNIDAVIDKQNALEGSLIEMLGPAWALIPFKRATYKFDDNYWGSSHWMRWASSFFMEYAKHNTPADIVFKKELAEQIWDPGFYIDVVAESFRVWIATLYAIEPGFQSTGYRRGDIIEIGKMLDIFIDSWEKSLLETKIIGPIIPYPPHSVYQPFQGHIVTSFGIGAIDYVTGVASFDPYWNNGIVFRHPSNVPGDIIQTAILNYEETIKMAVDYRGELWKQMRNKCGIEKFYDLRKSLKKLESENYYSDFVSIYDASVQNIISVLPLENEMEEIDLTLGPLGAFIGKEGKVYKAKRKYQLTTKRIPISIARRMDVSGIQLGYKLQIVIGGQSHEVALCKYSRYDFPTEDLEFFPSHEVELDFEIQDAIVYDVYQSDILSWDDEETFENHGKVAGKEKRFMNKRKGNLKAKILINFDLPKSNSNRPITFTGFANVTIKNIDPLSYPDGFGVGITVHEEINKSFDGNSDMPTYRQTETTGLHFAPSYLLVDPEYFKDLDAANAKFQNLMDKISAKYKKQHLFIHPLSIVSHLELSSIEINQSINILNDLKRNHPRVINPILKKFTIPSQSFVKEPKRPLGHK